MAYQLADKTQANLYSKVLANLFTRSPLWKSGHIEYYPCFRKAVLKIEVCYSRVTHPFAAIIKRILHFFLRRTAEPVKGSLDLHA